MQEPSVFLSGRNSETDELVMVLALETPARVSQKGLRLHKDVVERVHLERYRGDYLALTGKLPFDAVRMGSNPPDFVVGTKDGDVSIDCTALTLEVRRRAYGLFNRVRLDLEAEAGRGTLTHLAGTALRVWFGHGDGLPPKRTDVHLVSGLIELARSCRFDRDHLVEVAQKYGSQGLPERFEPDDLAIYWTAEKSAGFQVVPADLPGFECLLHMGTTVTQSDVRTELSRLVLDHDKQDIDHLLITLGGPDTFGVRYPAEEQIIQLISEEMIRGISVQSLQKITLHVWSTGWLWEFPTASMGPGSV